MTERGKRRKKITPAERERRRQAWLDRRWLARHVKIDPEKVRAGARKIYDAFMNHGGAPWMQRKW